MMLNYVALFDSYNNLQGSYAHRTARPIVIYLSLIFAASATWLYCFITEHYSGIPDSHVIHKLPILGRTKLLLCICTSTEIAMRIMYQLKS